MSVVFIEGFQGIETANFGALGYGTNGTPSVVAGGRFPTGAHLSIDGLLEGVLIPLPSGIGNSLTFGFALRVNDPLAGTEDEQIFQVVGDGGSVFSINIDDASGRLVFSNGSSETEDVVGNRVLSAGVWYYVEAVYDESGGTVDVYINNQLDFQFSGSFDNSTTNVTSVYFGYTFGSGHGSNRTEDFDVTDFYVDDANRLGDCRVTLRAAPDSVASSAGISFSDTGLVEDVDERPHDGDTSYVFTTTPGAGDIYYTTSAAFPDTPDTIHAVALRNWVSKSDAGATTLRNAISSDGNISYGATVDPPTGGYESLITIYNLDPDGNVAWTEAQVEALEYGFDVVS